MFLDCITEWISSRRFKPVPIRLDSGVPASYPIPLEMGQVLLHSHYQMLQDEDRVAHFRRAIEDLITSDDIVLDIGTGSGILALLAAERARKVYAVEVDPAIAGFAARAFDASPNREKLTLFLGDAAYLRLPERVDVITCELLDTVLLNEPQVEILRLAGSRLLKPDGRFIPAYARNFVALANCSFRFYERIDLRVAHWEPTDLPSARELTPWAEYCRLTFGPDAPEGVDAQVVLRANHRGTATAVKLMTVTGFGNGDEVGPCLTMNRPLVIPIPEKLDIVPDAAYRVRLSYRFGERYQNVRCSAARL